MSDLAAARRAALAPFAFRAPRVARDLGLLDASVAIDLVGESTGSWPVTADANPISAESSGLFQ